MIRSWSRCTTSRWLTRFLHPRKETHIIKMVIHVWNLINGFICKWIETHRRIITKIHIILCLQIVLLGNDQ